MIVLIPAYEPNEKMLKLVLELKEETDYKILIVDDGSGESYKGLFNKAKEYGCTVLSYPGNKGKGFALKTGFSYIQSNYEADKVVCADSDGQHSVADIIKIGNAIGSSKSEMVLGVRQFEGDVPFKSRFGNCISAFTFKMATGIMLDDTQTGLRGYSFNLLPWLCSVDGERFEYEQNLLLRSKKSGVNIKQLPIATIYDNSNKGTHFRPIYDSISVLWPILKYSGSSILAFGVDSLLLFTFQKITNNWFVSVVLARVISASMNYLVNKIFVFDSEEMSDKQSAPKYFSLALVIMLLNYCMLTFFIGFVHMNKYLAKILTELTLFTMSFTVQKLFVFKKDKDDITLRPS